MAAYERNAQTIPDDSPGGSSVRQAVADQNSEAIDDLYAALNSHSNSEGGLSHTEIDDAFTQIETNYISTMEALLVDVTEQASNAATSESNAAASESNAATSESNAAASENAASDSADAAALSETAAGQALTDILAEDYYGKENIVGTVSELADVPTGAIIESGRNASGEYAKFADGTVLISLRGLTATGTGVVFTLPAEIVSTLPVTVSANLYTPAIPIAGLYTVIPYQVSNTSVRAVVATDSSFVQGLVHINIKARWF